MSKLDPAIDLRVNRLKEQLDRLIDIFNKFEHTPGTDEWGDEVRGVLETMFSDLSWLMVLCIPGAAPRYLWVKPGEPYGNGGTTTGNGPATSPEDRPIG